jgi:hypothetical protein
MPHDPVQRRPGTIHIWDPLAAWPSARRPMWAALAVLVSLTQGPGFVRSLTPAAGESVDFFQEWASARNFLDGTPIYTDLEVSAARYLGRRSQPGEGVMVSKNAHPPASVLLAVPFGLLDYPRATLIWNLLSLAAFAVSLVLLARDLGLRPPPWAILPAITLLLICNPFRQQVNQGQFNLLLLLLMTGVWTAERSGRSALAGMLLGAATAFKLFPGFFFLYFLLRRRWTVVASGLAAIAMLSLVSVAVLGQETYDSYLREVFPAMSTYRNWWSNASLAGFWVKWFDSGAVSTISDPRLPSYLEPLAVRPAVALAGFVLSAGAVLISWAKAVFGARSQSQRDLAFGLTLTTMLVLSPIAWDHYFLLLLLPIAQLWIALSTRPGGRLLLSMLLVGIWINPVDFWVAVMPRAHAAPGTAALLLSLVVVSFQCFALLGLFLSGFRLLNRDAPVLQPAVWCDVP